jgi:hypothetical protein
VGVHRFERVSDRTGGLAGRRKVADDDHSHGRSP